MSNNTKVCSCSGSCCTPKQEIKKIDIDFLYLDLNTCERCQGAESNLDQAINEVSAVLKSAGYEVSVNKVNITTPELATKYEFLSSPTIRINGNDIALEVTETSCKDCGDICGDSVDCRSWVYEGVEHPEPPKEMIVNAIMKEVYGGHSDLNNEKSKYVIPQNLKIFFDGLKTKKDV
ncbi:MAG: DUF2703 domain-containing protein [Clostridia bacterium]|nr:DUF2703 domain-containing protein [Clostridia bacterium]